MVIETIQIHSTVQNIIPQAQFAFALYQDVVVRPSHNELKEIMNEEFLRVRQGLTLESLYDEPGIVESRWAFKALGLDPARYRPSQDALLRRILSRKEMYFINTGVDVNNLLSIRYRVPMGLYDVGKISGDLVLKVGSKEEMYFALNDREINCEQKLILCDRLGPIGSPYVDSKRTSITESTKAFFHVVYFCYNGFHQEAVEDMLKTFIHFHGGITEGYRFIRLQPRVTTPEV